MNDWLIKYSVSQLFHRKLRTSLTIIAIAIGILTITLLVGIGQGINYEVERQLNMFGPRNFIIAPFAKLSFGSASSPRIYFTDKDLKAVRSSSYIEQAEPSRSNTITVVYGSEKQIIRAIGANYKYISLLPSLKLSSGRLFLPNERKIVIVGHNVAYNMFNKPIRVNSKLTIEGKSFRVVGVLKESGNSFAPLDDIIFIPLEDMKDITGDNKYSAIAGLFKEGTNIAEASSDLEDILVRVRKVLPDDKDFSIITSKSITDIFEKIMFALNAFLGGAGFISIVVAAVGIANTMFASVLERTREIGTIKAIGGTNAIVYKIVFIESALIGVIGGLLGIILSYIIAYILSYFSVPIIISIPIAFISVLLSILVAVIASLIPAKNAASISPTEALRYE